MMVNEVLKPGAVQAQPWFRPPVGPVMNVFSSQCQLQHLVREARQTSGKAASLQRWQSLQVSTLLRPAFFRSV